MAEKKEHHEKPRKKTLVGVTARKTEKKGEHVLIHHYEDEHGHESAKFATATSGMEDLHQHIDDHLGPEAEDAEQDQQQQQEQQAQGDQGEQAGAGEGEPAGEGEEDAGAAQ